MSTVPIIVDDPAPQPLCCLPVSRRLPKPCPPPGIYPGVPDAEYHSWSAVSQSLLKKCLVEFDGGCPAVVRHYLDTADESPTAEQRFGTAFHMLALQGGKVFEKHYPGIVEQKTGELDDEGNPKLRTRVSKEWKAAVAKYGRGACLWDTEFQMMKEMLAHLQGHPTMGPIVAGPGQREVAIVWDDPDFNVRCKCRIDWLHDRYIADLKTAADASPPGFGRAAGRLGYHLQAAFANRGLDVLHKAGKSSRGARPFIIAAQRKEPPYLVATYGVDNSEMANGLDRVRMGLAEMVRAITTDTWEAYGDDVQPLLLPVWCGGPSRDEL